MEPSKQMFDIPTFLFSHADMLHLTYDRDQFATIKDAEGPIEKVLGWTKGEIVGKGSLRDLIMEKDAKEFVSFYKNKIQSGEQVSNHWFPINYKHKKGHYVLLQVLVNYYPGSNVFHGILFPSVNFITRGDRVLSAQAEAAEYFVSRICHELRNPLHCIIASSKFNEEDWVESKDTVLHSANLMLGIINQLLDLSTLRAGKLRLSQSACSLDNLVKDIRRTFNGELSSKKFMYEERVSVMNRNVFMDHKRLTQVLINLLSNAIKYTEPMHRIFLRIQEKPNNRYTFSVGNEGVPIPEKLRSKLFNPYQRASTEQAGTGLGLAIVREILMLLNSVCLISYEEGFNVFSFTVTLLAGPETSPTNSSSRRLADPVANVLLVEDVKENRSTFRKMLPKTVDITEVVDGKSAIVTLKHNRFDIIFMDLRMPGLNGVQASKYIRSTLGLNTPIVAVTGDTNKNAKQQCEMAGMNEFITKPFTAEQILDKIRKYVQ
jgi:PAS domain S-box-containing protein